jgi:GAF domain-containing protein
MTDQSPLDPTTALGELARIDLGLHDLHGVLTRVADLAKRTIPGADEVSVTLVQGGHAHTAAYTNELALDLDERQYDAGEGPCLTAAAEASVVPVPDLRAEERWPEYAGRAVERGVLSSLSTGLPMQRAITGGLNLYALKANAFDDDAIEIARTFASYAAVALANAELYASTAALAQQMQEAMKSRAVIEQAKGILMSQLRCSADGAFDVLTRHSQNSNRKLRDIAQGVVDSTQL